MIKLVLVCEVAGATTVEQAREKLDAFRESVIPSQNYGLTLYEATEQVADTAVYADAPGDVCDECGAAINYAKPGADSADGTNDQHEEHCSMYGWVPKDAH